MQEEMQSSTVEEETNKTNNDNENNCSIFHSSNCPGSVINGRQCPHATSTSSSKRRKK